MTYFDPQPPASDLPARLPNPFRSEPPPAIARRAAGQLQAQLHRGEPISASLFQGVRCGKMFGVLVAVDGDGQVGYLRGFSGMVAGSWHVEGFVGPLFDPGLRDLVWPAGQAELAELDRRCAALGGRHPWCSGAATSQESLRCGPGEPQDLRSRMARVRAA